mmetsp:Transcript_27586/g.60709  ORF Transcript_27586/g.60709 Transcript_27586/m.60709 type:complete len:313 (+) Transcript_27586:511-1449(+)
MDRPCAGAALGRHHPERGDAAVARGPLGAERLPGQDRGPPWHDERLQRLRRRTPPESDAAQRRRRHGPLRLPSQRGAEGHGVPAARLRHVLRLELRVAGPRAGKALRRLLLAGHGPVERALAGHAGGGPLRTHKLREARPLSAIPGLCPPVCGLRGPPAGHAEDGIPGPLLRLLPQRLDHGEHCHHGRGSRQLLLRPLRPRPQRNRLRERNLPQEDDGIQEPGRWLVPCAGWGQVPVRSGPHARSAGAGRVHPPGQGHGGGHPPRRTPRRGLGQRLLPLRVQREVPVRHLRGLHKPLRHELLRRLPREPAGG